MAPAVLAAKGGAPAAQADGARRESAVRRRRVLRCEVRDYFTIVIRFAAGGASGASFDEWAVR